MHSLRWFNLAVLTVVLTAGTTGATRAADPEKVPPPSKEERKAFDDKVRKSLFDLINHGVDLYNGGDWAGCYRLYEGSLRSINPLLDHRPDLQKAITDGLKEAETLPRADNQAFHLRKVLDKVRADLKGDTPAPGVKSLWERLGGEKNVTRVVDDFVELAVKDPKVNFFRDGKYKSDEETVVKLKRRALELISSGSGGPLKYSGRDLKQVHQDMAITDAEFDAMAADFKTVLGNNGVKAADIEDAMKSVEATRKLIVAPKKPVDSTAAKTLWDRLGGEKGVGKVVDDLLATVTKDPKVNFFRKPDAKPTVEEIKAVREKVIDYISSKTGGPHKYEGKSMKAVHAGMSITEDQFDTFADYFKAVLEKNGVKGDDLRTLMDAVNSTKKDIVKPKRSDDKKADDKPADDKKIDDKKADDKKGDTKKADDKKAEDKAPVDK